MVATLPLVFVPSSPAFAEGGDVTPDSIGIRILDAPPTLSSDPGTSFKHRIEGSTMAEFPMPVELYAASPTIEGGTFAGAQDRTPNDLSN